MRIQLFLGTAIPTKRCAQPKRPVPATDGYNLGACLVTHLLHLTDEVDSKGSVQECSQVRQLQWVVQQHVGMGMNMGIVPGLTVFGSD